MGFKGRLIAFSSSIFIIFILFALNSLSEHEYQLYELCLFLLFTIVSLVLGFKFDKEKFYEMELNNRDKKIKYNSDKYKSLFNHHPDAVYEFDTEGRFVSGNQSLEQLTGYSINEILHHSFYHMVHPDDLPRTINHFQYALNGEYQHYEIRIMTKKGSILYVNVTNLPVYLNGTIIGVYGIAKDVTEDKKAERALNESETKYRIIAEYTSDLIRVMDTDGRIQFASPSHQHVLGTNPKEIIGKNWTCIIYSEDETKAEKDIKNVIETKQSMYGILRYKSKQKDYIWIEANMTPVVQNGEVNSIVVVSRDISERIQLENQLIYEANHDSLTGLANRRNFEAFFHQKVKDAKENNKEIALLYFDLDRFKLINDTLGHGIGDILLKEVAARLKANETNEELVYRLGGDEFALLIIKETDAKIAAKQTAKDILGKINQPFHIDGKELHITTSIGISTYPTDGQDVNVLMKSADKAMYKAKEEGKNKFHFSSDDTKEISYDQIELENDLRKALEGKEFFIEYQPRVNTKTNQIVGFEALLRWMHPIRGIISPGEFIPIAEETGLIVPIGDWVMETVCKQSKIWEEKGYPPFFISINLSLKQFISHSLIKTVKKVFKDTGINPAHIEFEVTESMMVKDMDLTIEILEQLKEIGVRVSIDDFGTGFSSLTRLKYLPVDILKVDQSFIKDVPDGYRDVAITSSVISLGKHLQLTVVAEGVEKSEQLKFLLEEQCDEYQGFLYSKPVAPEQIDLLFKDSTILEL